MSFVKSPHTWATSGVDVDDAGANLTVNSGIVWNERKKEKGQLEFRKESTCVTEA